jgi:hypothetical protein
MARQKFSILMAQILLTKSNDRFRFAAHANPAAKGRSATGKRPRDEQERSDLVGATHIDRAGPEGNGSEVLTKIAYAKKIAKQLVQPVE